MWSGCSGAFGAAVFSFRFSVFSFRLKRRNFSLASRVARNPTREGGFPPPLMYFPARLMNRKLKTENWKPLTVSPEAFGVARLEFDSSGLHFTIGQKPD